MNPLEQFAITIIMGILSTVVKNPAHAAALQTQLMGIATDIGAVYGYEMVLANPPAIAVSQPAKVAQPQPGRSIGL
jgi:hypothetical protein